MSALVTLLANIVAPLQRQFINFIRIAICVEIGRASCRERV